MKRVFAKLMIIACLLFTAFETGGCGEASQPPVLRVAIPYSENVQDPGENYYVKWLESQTGLDIEVLTIRQNRSTEYLESLFASQADVDIVMFGGDFTITEDELSPFIDNGDIWRNGDMAYYPNFGSTAGDDCGQILWINYDWLKTLNIPVPKTTDEFTQALSMFKELDPNGNGIKDEIPLSGSAENYAYSPVELLLNSFVYNDPYHGRYEKAREGERLSCITDEFRDGLRYIRKLYQDGLLDEQLFEGSYLRLTELVNSPIDLVGAFTTDSISNIIYSGNPEIMAKFIHVAPLEGPKGTQNALFKEKEPAVGAIITERSTKKEEAALLLDTMMSTEGSLIARFGEQGVDWEYSTGLDVSIYGGPSTIVTKNYIWNTPQNKHLSGIGPMNVPKEYLEGVTWNGVNSDTEYIDARAQMSCKDYLPIEISKNRPTEAFTAFSDRYIRDFVMGEKDIDDEREWEAYVQGCKAFSK